jgi:hypothetical protein
MLKDLEAIQLATRTPKGWICSAGAIQLMLPFIEPENYKNCSFSGIDSSSSADSILVSSIVAEEEVQKKTTKNVVLSEQGKANLKALKEEGIADIRFTRNLANNEDITPELIKAQAERLREEEKFSTGLLITVLRSGDPLPASHIKNNYRRYVTGKDSAYINS